jgi:hypothetical protein
MDNIVHIDEKWFYLTRESQHCYLLPSENLPHRTATNKTNILKVMFLVAVARPHFDSTGAVLLDGKVGLWPFITQRPADRSSKNRP